MAAGRRRGLIHLSIILSVSLPSSLKNEIDLGCFASLTDANSRRRSVMAPGPLVAGWWPPVCDVTQLTYQSNFPLTYSCVWVHV